ncbi:uncharacterized protein TNIN_289931 [Trichonephila inaurata madagascariensis]|uniref:Uncharacterized protein n=1 Tax=Trichonephila inaurata madagascariensis TaxID=2747483 RepID=A0A8X7BXJ9_9ARAC|nr:uncharacterized protein TNIN_289931 [Trichonephila inaurata madagascariensis]
MRVKIAQKELSRQAIDISFAPQARSIPPLPERPDASSLRSECSLKNFQVTLRTYIHFQAQLMQLKTILGKRVLKTSKAKLDDTTVSLQRKIGNLDTLNKTAMEMFEKLKQSSQSLIPQGNEGNSRILSVIKEKQRMPGYFQERKTKILKQMQEITKHTQHLRQSDYFKNLGNALDGIFA